MTSRITIETHGQISALSIKLFLNCIEEGRSAISQGDRGLKLNEKKKIHWVPTFCAICSLTGCSVANYCVHLPVMAQLRTSSLSLCFLTVEAVWPAIVCTFPWWLGKGLTSFLCSLLPDCGISMVSHCMPWWLSWGPALSAVCFLTVDAVWPTVACTYPWGHI